MGAHSHGGADTVAVRLHGSDEQYLEHSTIAPSRRWIPTAFAPLPPECRNPCRICRPRQLLRRRRHRRGPRPSPGRPSRGRRRRRRAGNVLRWSWASRWRSWPCSWWACSSSPAPVITASPTLISGIHASSTSSTSTRSTGASTSSTRCSSTSSRRSSTANERGPIPTSSRTRTRRPSRAKPVSCGRSGWCKATWISSPPRTTSRIRVRRRSTTRTRNGYRSAART